MTGKPPREALEICARELALDTTQICVLPSAARGTHYKSAIFYVTTAGSKAPRFVVKVDTGSYDARHETEALEYAADLLGHRTASDGIPARGLDVVQPVGWGTDPSFLITRYQPGELAQTAIDRVALGWRRFRPFDQAHANARGIGRWLGEFRARGASDDGGLDPAAYLDVIRERADMLNSTLSASESMTALLRRVESYMDQLADEDVARMHRRYPIRGDARPKNFLVGEDGAIYAFDMEGFGFGSMEHDLCCLHHALEYDGVRSPAAGRRASALWRTFWEEYEQHGSSPSFALLGYVYFLLDTMRKTAKSAGGIRRRGRNQIWLRSRLRWLAGLTGDLRADAASMTRDL